MSKKKDKQWKQSLREAMEAEAEEIEKEAEPFRAELSQEKKDEMYQNIMQRIRETEKKSRVSGDSALPRKKKPFWRHPLKVAGVAAAAVVLIFGTSLVSEGNRMYWLGQWRALFEGSETEKTDNGGDSIVSETSEQEAREIAWEELGIAVPEFYYLPDGIRFAEATIDLERIRVVFAYSVENDYFYLTVSKNQDAIVGSGFPDGNHIENIRAGKNGEEIKVSILEDNSEEEQDTLYMGRWVYNNCGYELSGMENRDDLIVILENMQYIQ